MGGSSTVSTGGTLGVTAGHGLSLKSRKADVAIDGSAATRFGNDSTLAVGHNATTTVGSSLSLSVASNLTATAGSNFTLEAGAVDAKGQRDITLKSNGNVVIKGQKVSTT